MRMMTRRNSLKFLCVLACLFLFSSRATWAQKHRIPMQHNSVDISRVEDPSLKSLNLLDREGDPNSIRKLRRYARSYWKIKNFEYGLYRKMGVPLFGKYWINSGSFWTWKLSHSKFLLKYFPSIRKQRKSNIRNSSKDAVKELLDFVVDVEKIHLLLTVGIYLIPITEPAQWNPHSFAIMTIVNITGNLYPILNARLVRGRCLLMLDKLERRELSLKTDSCESRVSSNSR